MHFSFLSLTCFVLLISPELACQQKSKTASRSIRSILLTEFTRGTNRSIEISPAQTTVRVNDTELTAPTPTKTWQSLAQQVADWPVASLPKIPILSKKHQVDAALHATLTVVTRDSTYTSDTFDHNAPPERLRTLVDSLYRQIPAALQEKFQR